MNEQEKIEQWKWVTTYCKKVGIPPAQNWAWELGEKEYKKHVEKNDN